jgi:pimeloyl-ACP methyl ester carboxylesterase
MERQAPETGYIQSDDVKLFYRRFRGPGGRTPLVIFHGANYYDSLDWLDVAAGIAEDREVLAWDARGFGQSGWSEQKNYSYDAYLDDALRLLEHCGWRKAVVLGHSIGGSYALLFAARLPDSAAGLILVDHCPAGPGAKATGASSGNRAKVYPGIDEALADSSRHPAARNTPAWESFASRLRRVDDGYITPRDPDFSNRVPNIPGWQTRFPVTDMWKDLKTVSCPVLVVRGSASDRYRAEALERLALEYPHIVVATVESGHDVAGGAPHALVDEVRVFLEGRAL